MLGDLKKIFKVYQKELLLIIIKTPFLRVYTDY